MPDAKGLQLPKIRYKIVQSLKFVEDCKIVTKIVTFPKQLFYVARDVMCDHVIYRPARTLIHGNLWKIYREMVFKDCKVQKIVSFLLRFQGGCRRL